MSRRVGLEVVAVAVGGLLAGLLLLRWLFDHPLLLIPLGVAWGVAWGMVTMEYLHWRVTGRRIEQGWFRRGLGRLWRREL